jgi:hypothetical protein
MIYALPAYGAFCVAFSYLNAYWIKRNKRIYHGLNGGLHLAIIISCAVFIQPVLALLMPFEGRVLFDWPLNLFRDLPIGYVSQKPDSVIDRMEKAVFEKLFYFIRKQFKTGSYSFLVGVLPKLIYATLFVVLLVLYSRR